MQQDYNGGSEINFLDYWRVIKKRKWMIGAFVVVITILTAVVSLVMPKYYKAQVVVMPIGGSKGGGLNALAGQFGGLVGMSGGVQTPSQQLMALLHTRTLAENVINKNDLLPILSEKTSKNAAMAMEKGVDILLSQYVKFSDDKKNGVISVSAEFQDPKLAAEVANSYVEGLQKFINDNSLTAAKRNRIFIGKQLEQNKRELLESGKDLNNFYKLGGVSSVESKMDVFLADNATQGLINSEDRVKLSLEDLNKEKADIESKLIVKDVPQQAYLRYLTLRSNLLAQINNLLSQQYEMAKIEESKEDFSFQVIDPARVPTGRFKPKRTQMVMKAFVSSLLLGVFAAFFLEYVEKMKRAANFN